MHQLVGRMLRRLGYPYGTPTEQELQRIQEEYRKVIKNELVPVIIHKNDGPTYAEIIENMKTAMSDPALAILRHAKYCPICNTSLVVNMRYRVCRNRHGYMTVSENKDGLPVLVFTPWG